MEGKNRSKFWQMSLDGYDLWWKMAVINGFMGTALTSLISVKVVATSEDIWKEIDLVVNGTALR